ncbi:MAG: Ig-like domain-containing protein, partial [Lachnospiraceae bacterium]|nr:Ig-like domain-containing protein [Lachnospiraceae bacterium]
IVIVSAVPVYSKAYNEKRTNYVSIKVGKENSSLKLTKDIDNLIYDFEVKDTCYLSVSASAKKVTGDVAVRLTYKSSDSSALVNETIDNNNNEFKWNYKSSSLLMPGKYYIIISGSESGVTSDMIKLKVNTENIKLNDKEDNNFSFQAQYQAFDGTERTYSLSRLASYGFKDDVDDWIFFNTDQDGFFIRIEPLNKFSGQMYVELHSNSDTGLNLINNYFVKDLTDINRRDLPKGKYYLSFRYDFLDNEDKAFDNSQIVYRVTVAPSIGMESVKLSSKSLTLGTKGSFSTAELYLTTTPKNAIAKKVEWKSSNNKVATVKDGKVTAKGVGSANITCKVTGLDGSVYNCKCTVKVAKQKVTLDKTSISLKKGETYTLKATLKLKESVTWYSDDSSIAKISDKGVVTAVKSGKTTVYAKSKSGVKSDVCTVEVAKEVPQNNNNNNNVPKVEPVTENITLSASYKTIDVGFNTRVTLVSGTPGGNWSVSNGLSIIKSSDKTVDVKGVIEGNATVTYSVSGVSKSITITVE